MVKIIQKNEECIGCGMCENVCHDFWELDGAEGKAKPTKGFKNEEGDYEFEVEKVGCNQEAIDSCPVQIISIQ